MKSSGKLSASFRDPSGFLFRRDGILYRQVNQSYAGHYRALMDSGLYERLVKTKKLVPHVEVDLPPEAPALAACVIRPEPVDFISYPYEWSFSQLRDAALLTLSIVKKALEFGLSLKDASAYNIQFHQGRPILIDTLSFEPYIEGRPWIAYRQFCQHFLAPLALMAFSDVRLSQLLRIYIDGIPLDLVSKLLPTRTRLNLGLLAHIHMHASAQKRFADSAEPALQSRAKMSKAGFEGVIGSLENTVRGLKWEPKDTEWGDYYQATNYSKDAFDQKAKILREFIEQIRPRQVWDLGANTGIFSRVASGQGILTISSDIDPAAVEKNYREVREKKETYLLPLVMDLTNPSPGLGWQNEERSSLVERGPVDAVMALALIHHLAISNNVPLPDIAAFFARLGRWLVIEFVPKEDSQVERLLKNREDIFDQYHQEGFERAFGEVFSIRDTRKIEGSKRLLYLMEKTGDQ